jgi:hypothetical protein
MLIILPLGACVTFVRVCIDAVVPVVAQFGVGDGSVFVKDWM